MCPLDLLRRLELAALPDFVRLWDRVLDRPINGHTLVVAFVTSFTFLACDLNAIRVA